MLRTRLRAPLLLLTGATTALAVGIARHNALSIAFGAVSVTAALVVVAARARGQR